MIRSARHGGKWLGDRRGASLALARYVHVEREGWEPKVREFGDLHPILRRQLRRSGIASIDAVPEQEAWRTFLDRITTVYEEAADAEELNERALGLASVEMQGLYLNLEQRVADRTREIELALANLEAANAAVAESEQRYRLLAENASDIVWRLDADGVMVWVSPAVESVLGWEPKQLLGTHVRDLVHPDDQGDTASWTAKILEGEVPPPLESRWQAADGSYRWLSLHARRIADSDGSMNGLIVGMRDIHEEVLARAALDRSQNLLRLAIDGAPQGMAVAGLDLSFRQVNPALCTMLGRDQEWMLSHSVRDVVFPEDFEADLAGRSKLRDGAVEKNIQECRWRKSDGSIVWVLHSTGLLRDAQNNPLFYVSHIQDNTEAHKLGAELAFRASHDPLTGLTNRDKLEERIATALNFKQRRGGAAGLLFCDLDYFSSVNSTYGHAAGDEVLRMVAQRMTSVLRADDIVTRIGGDEFVVVLAQVYDMPAAATVAEKLRAAISEPMQIDETHVTTTTMSIGVALADPDIDAHRLLRNADAAMYEAKNAGRNRVVLHNDASTARAEMDIRTGLADGQFVPWFQPIVNLVDGAVIGYEALVRRVRPDGSISTPADFLPVAERTTLITELDLHILNECVQMLGQLSAPMHVSVNVSAATLASSNYAKCVIDALTASGVDPTRLHLEFTETALLSVTTDVRQAMSELADLGVRWYVDDFGTGYSSIAHLRDLPVAGLKLDLSFTAGLGSDDPTCEQLASALVGLADGLGLDTVAEGVETPQQAAILRAQGWLHAQGWLYGRPVAMNRVAGR